MIFETPFVGPGMRDAGERLDYLPMRLSLVPRLFATLRPPDVVLLHTSTPRDGKVSLGIEVNVLPAAIERVRARGGLVIAQIEPAHALHVRRRRARRGADRPRDRGRGAAAPRRRRGPAHEHAEQIAERVAGLVADGSTLQLGIGQVPDATLRALAAGAGWRSGRR